MQSDVRNSKRHVGTDRLQRIEILELLRPFVLLLRHGYCVVKNIKSIRELVIFKNKEMEQLVIHITSETLCAKGVNKILMATLSNTGCLFLSLKF
jgi:hypothetical protein